MTVPSTRAAAPLPASACPLDLDLSTVVSRTPPRAALEVRIDISNPRPAIYLDGELDQDSQSLLTEAVGCVAVTTPPPAQVVLDLSGITFCDVAGLRVLESCAALLRARGRELVIQHPSAIVARLATLGTASPHTSGMPGPTRGTRDA